ncbi:MAG TPA: HPr family phosphocarrier protein [Candidatus Contendobacter sp.]|nr:HPr family phosphocarrier protein [Candidatus Competibacteraceae bacterium]HRZ23347.1 HPr family phosphocarrier protein [Candidatus Contendobacter sp.]
MPTADPGDARVLKREIVIINKLGLHARAAAKFVTLAAGFNADIRILRSGREVNGKSIMGVMMLAAARGTRLELCASGPEAAQALEELDDLVRRRFDEDE